MGTVSEEELCQVDKELCPSAVSEELCQEDKELCPSVGELALTGLSLWVGGVGGDTGATRFRHCNGNS